LLGIAEVAEVHEEVEDVFAGQKFFDIEYRGDLSELFVELDS